MSEKFPIAADQLRAMANDGPLYPCADPECKECQKAFGPKAAAWSAGSPVYEQTRNAIAWAREQRLAEALAENERLRAIPVPQPEGTQAREALVEDCAKIAEGHIGAANHCNDEHGYDEACRDIAKAIRDAHGARS